MKPWERGCEYIYFFIITYLFKNIKLFLRLQWFSEIIGTTAKNGVVLDTLTPQTMYNQFKRPYAGSVIELYYIYRKTLDLRLMILGLYYYYY